MRKFKRYLAIGCTAMMVITAVGCSSTTTSSEAVEESTQDTATTETAQDTTTTDATTATDATQTADASIVFGKVTAINGTSITLALGTMSQGKDMGSGEAPTNADNTTTKSGTSSSTTETTTPAAPPSGEVPNGDTQGAGGQAPSEDAKGTGGQAPSGEAPSADGQAPDMSAMFEESGETLTIAVEDESLIKIVSGSETTTGSLSDIAVDTILNIEYDDSDNITSITIQSAGK